MLKAVINKAFLEKTLKANGTQGLIPTMILKARLMTPMVRMMTMKTRMIIINLQPPFRKAFKSLSM